MHGVNEAAVTKLLIYKYFRLLLKISVFAKASKIYILEYTVKQYIVKFPNKILIFFLMTRNVLIPARLPPHIVKEYTLSAH
jgi:hypothetical protein